MKEVLTRPDTRTTWFKKLGLSWANWDIFIPVINNSLQTHTDPVNLLQNALAKMSYILMHMFSLIWEHFIILLFRYIYWVPRWEPAIGVQHWRKQISCLLTPYDMARVLGGSTWKSITKLSYLDRKCVGKPILNRSKFKRKSVLPKCLLLFS